MRARVAGRARRVGRVVRWLSLRVVHPAWGSAQRWEYAQGLLGPRAARLQVPRDPRRAAAGPPRRTGPGGGRAGRTWFAGPCRVSRRGGPVAGSCRRLTVRRRDVRLSQGTASGAGLVRGSTAPIDLPGGRARWRSSEQRGVGWEEGPVSWTLAPSLAKGRQAGGTRLHPESSAGPARLPRRPRASGLKSRQTGGGVGPVRARPWGYRS